MESSLACVFKEANFFSCNLRPSNGEPSVIRAKNQLFCARNCGSLRMKSWNVMNCAKADSVWEPDKRWGIEMMTEEEWLGFERFGDKCKERVNGGIAELLECLEREAIMGEDEGKEPIDYNRRAQIFDKSSRVFQALKVKESTSNPTTTC